MRWTAVFKVRWAFCLYGMIVVCNKRWRSVFPNPFAMPGVKSPALFLHRCCHVPVSGIVCFLFFIGAAMCSSVVRCRYISGPQRSRCWIQERTEETWSSNGCSLQRMQATSHCTTQLFSGISSHLCICISICICIPICNRISHPHPHLHFHLQLQGHPHLQRHLHVHLSLLRGGAHDCDEEIAKCLRFHEPGASWLNIKKKKSVVVSQLYGENASWFNNCDGEIAQRQFKPNHVTIGELKGSVMHAISFFNALANSEILSIKTWKSHPPRINEATVPHLFAKKCNCPSNGPPTKEIPDPSHRLLE